MYIADEMDTSCNSERIDLTWDWIERGWSSEESSGVIVGTSAFAEGLGARDVVDSVRAFGGGEVLAHALCSVDAVVEHVFNAERSTTSVSGVGMAAAFLMVRAAGGGHNGSGADGCDVTEAAIVSVWVQSIRDGRNGELV